MNKQATNHEKIRDNPLADRLSSTFWVFNLHWESVQLLLKGMYTVCRTCHHLLRLFQSSYPGSDFVNYFE